MLHIKRGSVLGKQLRSFFFVSRLSPDHRGKKNQLPGDMITWRLPGNTCAAEEQIWINLDKVFHDAGFMLWPKTPNILHSILRIADYPSSSGFGYAIPSRGKDGVGSLRKLRQFEYRVCTFLSVYIQPVSNI